MARVIRTLKRIKRKRDLMGTVEMRLSIGNDYLLYLNNSNQKQTKRMHQTAHMQSVAVLHRLHGHEISAWMKPLNPGQLIF